MTSCEDTTVLIIDRTGSFGDKMARSLSDQGCPSVRGLNRRRTKQLDIRDEFAELGLNSLSETYETGPVPTIRWLISLRDRVREAVSLFRYQKKLAAHAK